MNSNATWPEEIRLSTDKQTLKVRFEDGQSFDLPAEYLRVKSPSAEVQGHAPDQRVTVPRKKNVHIVAIEPVGSYAVKLVFDDGHDTGLFTWGILHDLGSNYDRHWAEYLAELAAKGLSR